jgi:hypothetical protein
LTTLNWTIVDSDGSLFSRGKNNYYAIVVRGLPEEHPDNCIIELYVTDKEMTISEIKYNPEHEQIKLLSRQIVLGDLLPMATMKKVIDEMKNTAELRENEKPNYSISSSYP